jgi:hypothetical protein
LGAAVRSPTPKEGVRVSELPSDWRTEEPFQSLSSSPNQQQEVAILPLSSWLSGSNPRLFRVVHPRSTFERYWTSTMLRVAVWPGL